MGSADRPNSDLNRASAISGHPDTIFEAREAIELLTAKQIAQAFLRQRFPLTALGRQLRQTVQTSLACHERGVSDDLRAIASRLPTVESPHPELFQNLDLTPGEIDEFFGSELANIQVTKGCGKGCTFCAAAAEFKDVQMMPFAAAFKLAEHKRDFDARVDNSLDHLIACASQLPDPSIDNPNSSQPYREDCLRGLFAQDPFLRLIPTHYMRIRADGWPPTRKVFNSEMGIYQYYDSDPFDYRDPFFLHTDGSPADYGDVFVLTATPLRPIGISTAGWRPSDRVAQTAVRKIVNFAQKFPGSLTAFRVSVNPFTRLAQQSHGRYLEAMKEVIVSLSDLRPPPEICLFQANDNDAEGESFKREVMIPLSTWIDNHFPGIIFPIEYPPVSHYSGHLARADAHEDYDVMSCMPGLHIWPDGTMARQSRFQPKDESSWRSLGGSLSFNTRTSSLNFGAPKGARPIPIGKSLYHLLP